jgi:hypothetical protein
MKSLEKLILLYRNRIDNPVFDIFCSTSNNRKTYKSFSSDDILLEAFGEEKDQSFRNFDGHLGIRIFYSVFDKKERIDLCTKNYHGYVDLSLKNVPKEEEKRFLGIPYKKRWIETELSDEGKEKLQQLEDKGFHCSIHRKYYRSNSYRIQKTFFFITYEDLIYEIDEDLYKELKMFTIEALKQRSIGKLENAK